MRHGLALVTYDAHFDDIDGLILHKGAVCEHEADMGTMTIRGLDDLTINALKEKAEQEGKSVNPTILELLRENLGLTKKKRIVAHGDLDHLSATWTDEDYREFQKNAEDFEKIDENIRKNQTHE
jgi:plasmid stability protein